MKSTIESSIKYWFKKRKFVTGKDYVFIGGVPRSGTSLVQKILSLHSAIFAGPEFDHLPRLLSTYRQFKDGLKNGRQELFYNEEQVKKGFRNLLAEIFDTVLQREDKQVFAEKTPDNISVFQELQELFPDAKFIVVCRDPRANLHSFQKVAERANEKGLQVHLGNNLQKDIGMIDKYLHVGCNFLQRNPEKSLLVYYEDVVSHPTREVKKITEFLGVPFEEAMLDTSITNETSQLVASGNKTVAAWTSSDNYDQQITDARLTAWEKGLSIFDKSYVNWYFRKNGNDILAPYDFPTPSLLDYLFLAKRWLKVKLWR